MILEVLNKKLGSLLYVSLELIKRSYSWIMENFMQRFKDILYVVVTESDHRVALELAVSLANNNQARLTIVKVIENIPSTTKVNGRSIFTENYREQLIANHHTNLLKLVASVDLKTKHQTRILVGIEFLEIIREVLRNQHDLVIKTAESGDLMDRVFGGDDMHLLRKCPCPLWLVNPKAPQKFQRILAAVDVDDDYQLKELKTRYCLNLQILEMASSLALSEFSELHIVSAWETLGEDLLRSFSLGVTEEDIKEYIEEEKQQNKQKLNALMNKLEGNALDYLKPQLHQPRGSPRKEIPSLARKIKADLVVMGTVARTGIPGFFIGNTAETILNQLGCSVLAIKPQGFHTPVTLED